MRTFTPGRPRPFKFEPKAIFTLWTNILWILPLDLCALSVCVGQKTEPESVRSFLQVPIFPLFFRSFSHDQSGGPFSSSSSLWVTREWSPKMPAINWRRKKEGGNDLCSIWYGLENKYMSLCCKGSVFFAVIRVALCHRRTLEYAVCVQCF